MVKPRVGREGTFYRTAHHQLSEHGTLARREAFLKLPGPSPRHLLTVGEADSIPTIRFEGRPVAVRLRAAGREVDLSGGSTVRLVSKLLAGWASSGSG